MPDKISLDRMDEMLREVFKELKAAGGRARGRDVLAAIAPRLKLTPYELETTRTGSVRWDTHVRFYTTDCVKAGFLTKSDGYWLLTEAGEKALKLPPGELVRTATRLYRTAAKKRPPTDADDGIDAPETEEAAEVHAEYEKAREAARREIETHLDRMPPYDFQRLVSELLQGMGYHVPFVASPGPDGGVDIVAYKDPLGTAAPRIKVQVKHRESKVGAKDVRELEGLLRKEGDIGLIVSSGGFSADAEREIRSSSKHIETMDQDRLIALWQEHYDRVSQSGKSLLPLVTVHFLAPPEE